MAFSAQQKAAIDKFFAYQRSPEIKAKLKGKALYLFMTAAESEEAFPDMYDPLRVSVKAMANYYQMTMGGELLVFGVDGKGEISKTDALGRTEAMGRDI